MLARTDFNDDVSFTEALEVFKRYVRAKIKKGKGKEMDSPGGKVCTATFLHLVLPARSFSDTNATVDQLLSDTC